MVHEKRTLASQMIRSFTNIASNRNGAIASQVTRFFTVKPNYCITSVGEV